MKKNIELKKQMFLSYVKKNPKMQASRVMDVHGWGS